MKQWEEYMWQGITFLGVLAWVIAFNTLRHPIADPYIQLGILFGWLWSLWVVITFIWPNSDENERKSDTKNKSLHRKNK